MRDNLTTDKKIIDYLVLKDPVFKMLYEKFGFIKIKLNKDYYEAIISHIIGQQLSDNVKKIIYARFTNLVNEVTPTNILDTNIEDIRACGISYSKIKYIKELSLNIQNGSIKLNNLDSYSDNELIATLKKINGVGQWTAEMIAIFSLGRENIFSQNDAALNNGIKKAKGYKTLSTKRFQQLRNRYSPYCSYASLYFYAYNDAK